MSVAVVEKAIGIWNRFSQDTQVTNLILTAQASFGRKSTFEEYAREKGLRLRDFRGAGEVNRNCVSVACDWHGFVMCWACLRMHGIIRLVSELYV